MAATPWFKILFAVGSSAAGTLLLMFVAARLADTNVPGSCWIFGAICPAIVSLPVVFILVRRSERISHLHSDLVDAYARLKKVAEIDQLTDVLNRGTFLKLVDSSRSVAPGWILLLDVDHFKTINDRYGHGVGDSVLQAVAAVLRDYVRAEDLVGRLGGEEFAIYLAGVSRQTAIGTAERVRARVAGTTVAYSQGAPVSVTLSIGLADVGEGKPFKDCLGMADLAMYRAKHNGRNRISLAG